jgi:hypothetical protein
MVYPTIHLNGTSKDALFEALSNACAAIREAEKALFETSPNARDYYPQGDGAYRQASNEYIARLERLGSVRVELYEILEAIEDQGAR